MQTRIFHLNIHDFFQYLNSLQFTCQTWQYSVSFQCEIIFHLGKRARKKRFGLINDEQILCNHSEITSGSLKNTWIHLRTSLQQNPVFDFDMHFLDYEWFSVLSLCFLAISIFFSIFCEIIACIPYKIFYFVHFLFFLIFL